MSFRRNSWIFVFAAFLVLRPQSLLAQPFDPASGPPVLVLYDGPDEERNPGRLDAMYLVNLLGHFTTQRQVHPLETYRAGEWKKYKAVFTIIYQKKYTVPPLFIQDISQSDRTFCWLGNQAEQLEQTGWLAHHGIRHTGFSNQLHYNSVTYKGRTLVKGDPETNLYKVLDPDHVKVFATTQGPDAPQMPYVLQSGSFWLVADSPFSYSSENDRYLVFCDLLHDILGIYHDEDHPAILRIEDINAMSIPSELQATLDVIRRHQIPFSFGFVPMYVNPHERLEFRMADKPDVVHMLHRYVAAGGSPVLHGYTHQYRGVTTDDYEFWDDLGDRPIRGDSESFVSRRLEEAIRESMNFGIYPVTWETPHYAASGLDYRVIHRHFDTVFERRLAGARLDSDQDFPYPVIDMYGQYVIPEDLAYIPLEDQRSQPILDNAEAAYVVRDGYASVFYHPFLAPKFLEEIISGIQKRGFHFIDIKRFPNAVHANGRAIQTISGKVEITGEGRYLSEKVLTPTGEEIHKTALEVSVQDPVQRTVKLALGETYVAIRHILPPPSLFAKLILLAKGDLSVFSRKLETVFPSRAIRNPVNTTILWNSDAKGAEAIDQQSFLTVLTSLGFDIEQVEYKNFSDEELGNFSLLVIPQATARVLSPEVAGRIEGAVRGGITVVTDGESPLSDALHIQVGQPIRVESLQDHLDMAQDTRWPDHPVVSWISAPKADDVNVYYSERDEMHPLVIGGKEGSGQYLFFAPLFDELSGEGYARFPSFPQILFNEFHLRPMVRRFGADAYFEPGEISRQSVSIEVLAKAWRRYGIRTIHVAAWHSWDKWTYDYARLVKVAHQNGILVYAWFEWPEVSQKFWDEHPLWREKTALLTDAKVDWRLLMNMQDPQCLKEILKNMQTLLTDYDWDGVNVGELTFDSPAGPASPGAFTPFNKEARKEFKDRQGIDPVDIFKPESPNYWKTNPAALNAFYAYRRETNGRILHTVLQAISDINRKRGKSMEIVVTMLDALQHPELRDYMAIDVDRTVAQVNQFGATLQVEDPARDWALAPDRYLKLGKVYDQVALKKPYMIDINVLPSHLFNQKGFATAKPVGAEMFQLWQAASKQASRVCFYSESTIQEQDWELMPYAMASRTTVKRNGDDWVISTPNTVRLEVGRDTRRYHLDGQPWFCAEKGEVLIPPGDHELSFSRVQRSWFDTTQLDTYLLSISGELLESERVHRGLDVEYSSPYRCAMMFNKLPYSIYIDEVSTKVPVIKGDDGFTLFAPPGRHRLRVISETPGLYLVEFTSLVSASLIVLFGLLSSGLLAFLFAVIIISRRLRHVRRRFRGWIKGPDETPA